MLNPGFWLNSHGSHLPCGCFVNETSFILFRTVQLEVVLVFLESTLNHKMFYGTHFSKYTVT